MRTEFIGRGNYKIVPEATGADAVLIGAVTERHDCADDFSAEQQASRYTITVTANIQLRDVAKDTVLWSNPAISFARNTTRRARFQQRSHRVRRSSSFFTQESNALERISNEFSRSIVSAILEAF